jgi:hypothetical protein
MLEFGNTVFVELLLGDVLLPTEPKKYVRTQGENTAYNQFQQIFFTIMLGIHNSNSKLKTYLGQTQRIKETSGSDNSELVFEPTNSSGGTSLLSRGESGGRASKSSEGGEFHHLADTVP